MLTAAPTVELTRADIARFHQEGYLGPFTLCSPEEMAVIREKIVNEVFSTPGPSKNPWQSRHLDSPVVYNICSHPAIVERMAAIFGPDLVLWRSHFFVKEPGAKEIPWHQDLNYWPLEPVLNISAWVAIDPAMKANSCPEIIPGSHKSIVPSIKATEDMSFGTMADPAAVDLSKRIYMELQPGQFFLFNEKTLHRSEKNNSQQRRIGLAVRVTIPIVKVYHEQLFAGHKVLQLRGEDRLGFNDVGQPPVD
jgi:ectoine hydroxylase-related dioxygenase (phytanoyl-CoA dioxygenase family)